MTSDQSPFGEADDLVTGHEEKARVLGIGDGFLSEDWWCRAVLTQANRIARRSSASACWATAASGWSGCR